MCMVMKWKKNAKKTLAADAGPSQLFYPLTFASCQFILYSYKVPLSTP